MKTKSIIVFNLTCWMFVGSLSGDPIETPQVKWTFDSGGSIRGTALLEDDRVYFGNSNGTFFCLRADNAEPVWTYETHSTITSQPAVTADHVLVSSRGNHLYSLRKTDGSLEWSFPLDPPTPHKYGWDYLDASPVITGETVIISSGENRLFALSLVDGKPLWEFEAGDKIRTTPLFQEDTLYIPCYNGLLYILSATDGELVGTIETDGVAFYDTINGWDRSALKGRPALGDGVLVVGSRDGGLYGFDAGTLERQWRATYGMTWVASYPVIERGVVYVGWSDNFLVTAMDLETGEEIWKYSTDGLVFSDPVLDAEHLYVGSYDGFLYCLQKDTGKRVWKYPTGSPVFSAPVKGENALVVGNDDGVLFAFENAKAFRAVYQAEDDRLPPGLLVSDKIAPFLEARSFQRLDTSSLGVFLSERIQDQVPSVVVFAHAYLPDEFIDPAAVRDLFREYMESGGRVIWMHGPPKRLEFDEDKKVIGRSNEYARALWDVEFDILSDWATYPSRATEEGLKWGLPATARMKTVLFPETPGIVPLAYTELDRIAAFHKHYGGRPNSGFVFFRSWDRVPEDQDLELILSLAEYDLQGKP